jgi:hypothetical protein
VSGRQGKQQQPAIYRAHAFFSEHGVGIHAGAAIGHYMAAAVGNMQSGIGGVLIKSLGRQRDNGIAIAGWRGDAALQAVCHGAAGASRNGVSSRLQRWRRPCFFAPYRDGSKMARCRLRAGLHLAVMVDSGMLADHFIVDNKNTQRIPMDQFDNVSVAKRANVYFDGKSATALRWQMAPANR